MGVLTFMRAARRVIGLDCQPEYPHLEALLEAEEGKPGDDYRLAARIAPPLVAVLGSAFFGVMSVLRTPAFWFGALGALALAGGLWFLFDFLDKRIGPERARLRKQANDIWERYRGFASVVGMKPAFSQNVCEVLDEASSIYLKHSSTSKDQDALYGKARAKAVRALEDAMGRMLALGKPQSVAEQELELDAGWAHPLLQEMRDLDKALDNNKQTALNAASQDDPRARLVEARLELQQIDSAIEELEQR